MENFKKEMLKALEVCGELVGNAIIFTVIAVIAIGLGLLAEWQQHVYPNMFIYCTLEALHYVLFVCDVVVFIRRVADQMYHTFNN